MKTKPIHWPPQQIQCKKRQSLLKKLREMKAAMKAFDVIFI